MDLKPRLGDFSILSLHGNIIDLAFHLSYIIFASIDSSLGLSLLLSEHLLLHGVVLGFSFTRIIILIFLHITLDLLPFNTFIHLMLLTLQLLHIANFISSIHFSRGHHESLLVQECNDTLLR